MGGLGFSRWHFRPVEPIGITLAILRGLPRDTASHPKILRRSIFPARDRALDEPAPVGQRTGGCLPEFLGRQPINEN